MVLTWSSDSVKIIFEFMSSRGPRVGVQCFRDGFHRCIQNNSVGSEKFVVYGGRSLVSSGRHKAPELGHLPPAQVYTSRSVVFVVSGCK